MSGQVPPGQQPPWLVPGTAVAIGVGVDPGLSDCIITTSSKALFFTTTEVLGTASPVFRELVFGDLVGQKPRPFYNSSRLHSVASNNLDCEERTIVEVHLEDCDAEVAALVESLHQPATFWDSVGPIVSKEGTERILLLTPIVFKYDVTGILRIIKAVLASPTSLNSFIAHHEHGNLLATWTFARRYGLESVSKDVESLIGLNPSGMLKGPVIETPRFANLQATAEVQRAFPLANQQYDCAAQQARQAQEAAKRAQQAAQQAMLRGHEAILKHEEEQYVRCAEVAQQEVLQAQKLVLQAQQSILLAQHAPFQEAQQASQNIQKGVLPQYARSAQQAQQAAQDAQKAAVWAQAESLQHVQQQYARSAQPENLSPPQRAQQAAQEVREAAQEVQQESLHQLQQQHAPSAQPENLSPSQQAQQGNLWPQQQAQQGNPSPPQQAQQPAQQAWEAAVLAQQAELLQLQQQYVRSAEQSPRANPLLVQQQYALSAEQSPQASLLQLQQQYALSAGKSPDANLLQLEQQYACSADQSPGANPLLVQELYALSVKHLREANSRHLQQHYAGFVEQSPVEFLQLRQQYVPSTEQAERASLSQLEQQCVRSVQLAQQADLMRAQHAELAAQRAQQAQQADLVRAQQAAQQAIPPPAAQAYTSGDKVIDEEAFEEFCSALGRLRGRHLDQISELLDSPMSLCRLSDRIRSAFYDIQCWLLATPEKMRDSFADPATVRSMLVQVQRMQEMLESEKGIARFLGLGQEPAASRMIVPNAAAALPSATHASSLGFPSAVNSSGAPASYVMPVSPQTVTTGHPQVAPATPLTPPQAGPSVLRSADLAAVAAPLSQNAPISHASAFGATADMGVIHSGMPCAPGVDQPAGNGIAMLEKEEPKQAMEIVHDQAVNFINKIQARFASDERVYKAFQEILNMYRKGHKSTNKVYEEVAMLFRAHKDLLDEFDVFLPASSRTEVLVARGAAAARVAAAVAKEEEGDAEDSDEDESEEEEEEDESEDEAWETDESEEEEEDVPEEEEVEEEGEHEVGEQEDGVMEEEGEDQVVMVLVEEGDESEEEGEDEVVMVVVGEEDEVEEEEGDESEEEGEDEVLMVVAGEEDEVGEEEEDEVVMVEKEGEVQEEEEEEDEAGEADVDVGLGSWELI